MVNQPIVAFIALAGSLLIPAQATEIYANVGVNYHDVSFDTGDAAFEANQDDSDVGYHFAVGVRRPFGESQKHWLGFQLEFDEILGDSMIAFRALDYQYAIDDDWRLGAFIGAASLDTGASQTGYHLGGGVTYLNVLPQLDIGLDLRYGDRVARDRLLPDDPQSDKSPDFFYDVLSTSLYASWRF
ncbi:hypothetical protein GCM10011369_36160 [Neiella marina]|uniref:Outer membrane protein beta-barrel domain-containing protein n=1 Tax=Neiella marina TaxID=508461 RepID=A0A8J2XRX4_9GAMM|nr:hypothetical protein [Neiella marina]GGA90821.1 hypothetical protein GCM10011369_36160 [Neiella marina]